jgi:hypothetical protein
MKSKLSMHLFIVTLFLLVSCSKEEDAVPQQTLEESLSEVVAEVQQITKISQFADRLKSAYLRGFNLSTTELEEMSDITVFAMADNPYWLSDTENDLDMVSNHIVKGIYKKGDLKNGVVLTTIDGKFLKVSIIESGIFINNSRFIDEIASKDGNIIHQVLHPIYSNNNEIKQTVRDCDELFKNYIPYFYMFDAVFTDESDALNPSWTDIDDHTFNAGNGKIEKLYYDAYNILVRISVMTDMYDYYSFALEDRDLLLTEYAELRTLRAYLNLCLSNYFGDIPLLNNVRDYYKIGRNSTSEISNYIQFDLHDAEQIAPEENIQGYIFHKNSVMALKSRAILYTEGRHSAQHIINSGRYSLASEASTVYSQISSETILGIPVITDNEFGSFYSDREFIPLFRYTGLLLDFALAATMEGLLQDAWQVISLINERSNLETVNWAYETKTILFDIISREIKKEGVRFLYLKRFNMAEQVLGLQSHQKILPVPQKQITENPNILQNPGY